jgi:hypothetical protein
MELVRFAGAAVVGLVLGLLLVVWSVGVAVGVAVVLATAAGARRLVEPVLYR